VLLYCRDLEYETGDHEGRVGMSHIGYRVTIRDYAAEKAECAARSRN
jgi:hypothetical protein